VGSELLERCDERGTPLGPVERERCHGNPELVHMTVHLHVMDGRGGLYLQKRSRLKDLYPGKWDTAVGGHVAAGEDAWSALVREAGEELGIDARGAVALYSYLHSNAHESEYVRTFGMRLAGPFRLDPREIDEGRFFSRAEVDARLGTGLFTPNFEDEWKRLRASGFLDAEGGGEAVPAPA
jgi:isopentenyldiphosphate isomerase